MEVLNSSTEKTPDFWDMTPWEEQQQFLNFRFTGSCKLNGKIHDANSKTYSLILFCCVSKGLNQMCQTTFRSHATGIASFAVRLMPLVDNNSSMNITHLLSLLYLLYGSVLLR